MTSHDSNPAATAETFDELDPHGYEKGHGHDHGHVIVGPFTLRVVLAALLFCTVLTVFLAQAELWAEGYFHITIPWWVNVTGAMSIAVIKGLLVMGFFMQLKYDNPINTVLMCFCFAALAIFLGFTGMDLFNRGAVDPQKQHQVIAGGDLGSGRTLVSDASAKLLADLKTRLGSDEAAKARFEEMREAIHKAHGRVEAPEPTISTAGQSRPKTGLSGALSATEPAPGEEKAGEKKAEPEKHADAR
jgi:caa(3)-type oxidase subunit IV